MFTAGGTEIVGSGNGNIAIGKTFRKTNSAKTKRWNLQNNFPQGWQSVNISGRLTSQLNIWASKVAWSKEKPLELNSQLWVLLEKVLSLLDTTKLHIQLFILQFLHRFDLISLLNLKFSNIACILCDMKYDVCEGCEHNEDFPLQFKVVENFRAFLCS